MRKACGETIEVVARRLPSVADDRRIEDDVVITAARRLGRGALHRGLSAAGAWRLSASQPWIAGLRRVGTKSARAIGENRDDGRRKRRLTTKSIEHAERIGERRWIRDGRARTDDARIVADHIGDR